MARAIAIVVLVAAVACERAPEPRASGSIGWRPARVGTTVIATSTSRETPPTGRADIRRELHVRLEVLAVDGDRIAKLRARVDRDDHTIDGRPQRSLVGSYVLGGTRDHAELVKENGVLLAGEGDQLRELFQPMLADSAAAHAFDLREFRRGERYPMPAELVTWFGYAPETHVELTVTAITTRALAFAVVADLTFSPPLGAITGAHCTATLEIARAPSSDSDKISDCTYRDENGTSFAVHTTVTMRAPDD